MLLRQGFGDSIEYSVSGVAFGEQRQVLGRLIARDEHDAVSVDLEAGVGRCHIITHNEVEVLGFQLLEGVQHQVLGFGSEPYVEAPALGLSNLHQEVLGGDERESERSSGLLELPGGCCLNPEV